jgi:tetratricopeptide (TPR) repeat protein
MAQGRLEESQEMLQRVLEGQEKHYGPSDKSTLQTCSTTGDLYFQMGEHQKAQDMYERALRGFEQAFGHDSPSTVIVSSRLAFLQAVMSTKQQEETQTSDSPSLDPIVSTTDKIDDQESNSSEDSEYIAVTELESCSNCERLKRAEMYMPKDIPTILFVDHLLESAKKGCRACQFFEAVLHRKSPHVFSDQDISCYVSWVASRATSHPNASKVLFWVQIEPKKRDCEVYEIFTLPGECLLP